MKNETVNLPREAILGLQAYNKGDFYEAHEHFEVAWRQEGDDSREFYRALLQISGGFYRLTQDHPLAARNFFSHAQKWLSEFPDCHLGVNILQLNQTLSNLMKSIDQNKPSTEILREDFWPISPERGSNSA